MADYYPLVARAVSGLDDNTAEARRSLYERARAALVAQLRGVSPGLSESDITRERLALEEAIRKVEADQARRARAGRPAPMVKPASPPEPPPPPEQSEAPEQDGVPADEQPTTPSTPPHAEPPSDDNPFTDLDRPIPPRPPVMPPPAPPRPASEEAARTEAALRALRDRLATENSSAEVVPRWPRTTAAEPVQQAEQDVAADDAASAALDPEPQFAEPAPQATNPPRSGTIVKLVIALVIIAVLGTLGAAAYRQRAKVSELFQALRGTPTQTTRGPSQTQPKIEDRIGSATPERPPGTAPRNQSAPAQQSLPAVAQRTVLYEEDPSNPNGKRYVGSVIWRTETVSPGSGLAPELAVKANIEVPERHFSMTFSMVRNTDPALPASHTIDIRFNLPPDFPGGGVANVPGILMKQSEGTRGVPLAGLAVKVTNNVFLIGLSSVDTDVQRNTQLLKERTWFDVPIVYNNGTRAILAMEKGTPGERAFDDAFTAWGKAGTAAR